MHENTVSLPTLACNLDESQWTWSASSLTFRCKAREDCAFSHCWALKSIRVVMWILDSKPNCVLFMSTYSKFFEKPHTGDVSAKAGKVILFEFEEKANFGPIMSVLYYTGVLIWINKFALRTKCAALDCNMTFTVSCLSVTHRLSCSSLCFDRLSDLWLQHNKVATSSVEIKSL